MAGIYRSANGKVVDFDSIRLKNEDVIAVGNMKTNGRGDLLGAGGKIIKTKDQVMKEYYALNTPVAIDELRDQYQTQKPTPLTRPPVNADSTLPLPTEPAAPVVTEVVNLTGSGFEDEVDEPAVAAQPAPVRQPVAAITRPVPRAVADVKKELPAAKPAVAPQPVAPPVIDTAPAIRGSLASAVAKTSVTTQKEKLPAKKANGIQRF